MTATLIKFRHITKRFGGITALNDVSLEVVGGECHALMGENGAGKSTLGKVLAGIHRPDAGEVWLGGRVLRLHSPADATAAWIGMVHQELAFCPDLSVAENLCLGRYPRGRGGWLNRTEMRRRAAAALAGVGADLDVRLPMRALSTAQEQLVQIAAAVASGARILIFDEPTSSLSERESQRLFELIAELRGQGKTILYVSHRLPEVLRLCDRISVLRDGRHIATLPRSAASEAEMVRLMIGRTLSAHAALSAAQPPGSERLRVEGLTSPGRFADFSLTLRAGEIVGLAGLVGAGRTHVAEALFGLDRAVRGRVWLCGQPLRPGRVGAALRGGLGLAPEDRKRQGLVLTLSALWNFSLLILGRLRRGPLLRHAAERRAAAVMFDRLDVRAASLDAPAASLSGGNQQKIVLAKWLARRPSVLIVDEPTRGVDVGAKAAIHALLDELAVGGMAILLISSELPELLALCGRILVMREGRLVGEVPRREATEERLMALMAGASGG